MQHYSTCGFSSADGWVETSSEAVLVKSIAVFARKQSLTLSTREASADDVSNISWNVLKKKVFYKFRKMFHEFHKLFHEFRKFDHQL